MSEKLVVFVVGASGNTGKVIVQALLNHSDKFRVVALTRPSSLSKPDVVDFRSKGVEVRAADIETDSIEKLTEVLSGVDVLISCVVAEAVPAQKPLLEAAKRAGAKRVVPCDFGTPGKRGVREYHDQKLEIRDYVKNLGVHYTFIDVGWWMQLILPSSSKVTSIMGPMGDEVYGDKPMLVTDMRNIGNYVARIISDERTLDQYVIVWEDQITQQLAHDIAGRLTGESTEIQARVRYIPKGELEQRWVTGKEDFARTGNIQMLYMAISSQYFISMQHLGENTLEYAKGLGALDVRELYPDIHQTTLEEFARKFYAGDGGEIVA